MLTKENSWANENLSQESSDLMPNIKNKQSLEINRQCFFIIFFLHKSFHARHVKGMEVQ